MDAAWDFESIAQALEAASRGCLRDMELVLTDVPACIAEVPVTKLALAKFLTLEKIGILKHSQGDQLNPTKSLSIYENQHQRPCTRPTRRLQGHSQRINNRSTKRT